MPSSVALYLTLQTFHATSPFSSFPRRPDFLPFLVPQPDDVHLHEGERRVRHAPSPPAGHHRVVAPPLGGLAGGVPVGKVARLELVAVDAPVGGREWRVDHVRSRARVS